MTEMEQMGARAKAAARVLAREGAKKSAALFAAAEALTAHQEEILAENRLDLAAGREAGLTESLLDRLALSPARIAGMAEGMRAVASFPDPVGRPVGGTTHPNGMRITKVTVPLGVIGIIFEARPNVTADAAALCLKAGNAVILRGGKEAIRSNRSITAVIRGALEQAGLPADCVQLVQDTSRASAAEMMNLTQYLDVLIPRGGAGLIRAVVEQARVPVIQTGAGNCHIYVDASADPDQAAKIILNAKASRPSVCNACEKVLVHRAAAQKVLPKIKAALDTKNVVIHGCPETREILGSCVVPATEEDWGREYLDYILGVRVVGSLDEALEHIAKYSTGHSEAILTQDYSAARRFQQEVDSAAVYVNASTRFTDGGEFGLGAEIGISTQKLHARGPMGLEQLTSVKYLIEGDGQIR
ncbi:MAG: glutamate-5-semialdehyde dehydrogenase [Firmicutes bacterium]|nr:glutamate-5-semialdehyde dehydrogenase [Bacillota bacterium]